jgi:hypothetical protein
MFRASAHRNDAILQEQLYLQVHPHCASVYKLADSQRPVRNLIQEVSYAMLILDHCA